MLDRVQNRRNARRLRRQLNADQQAYVDRITSHIWSETGDVGEAERITRHRLEQDVTSMGFDHATILLLVQLAVAIYQALKHLDVLSPSPELVSALFEGAVDD